MFLKELSEQLAEKENISVYKAKKCINSTIDLIAKCLRNNEYVYLKRFGKIFMHDRYWKYRRGNLDKSLGFWDSRKKIEGYSYIPSIRLSRAFKNKCKLEI